LKIPYLLGFPRSAGLHDGPLDARAERRLGRSHHRGADALVCSGAGFCIGRMKRSVVSAVRGGPFVRLAVWSILRPRRYDARLTGEVLEATRRDARAFQSTDVAPHVLDPLFDGAPDSGSPARAGCDLVPGPGQAK